MPINNRAKHGVRRESERENKMPALETGMSRRWGGKKVGNIGGGKVALVKTVHSVTETKL